MPTNVNSTKNPDGSQNLSINLVEKGDDGSVSATAFVDGYKDSGKYDAAGANVSIEKSDNSASISAQHIPTDGKQAAAAVNINLLNKNDHRMDVNASSTLGVPKIGPVYFAHELGLNYCNKDIAASLSAKHMPTIGNQATAATKVNLLNNTDNKLVMDAYSSLNAPSIGANSSILGGGINFQHKNLATSLTAHHNSAIGTQATAAAAVSLLNTRDHKLNANAFTQLDAPIGGPKSTISGGGIDYLYKDKFGASASMVNKPMVKQQDYNLGGSLNLYKTPTLSVDVSLGATKNNTKFDSGKWNSRGSINLVHKF